MVKFSPVQKVSPAQGLCNHWTPLKSSKKGLSRVQALCWPSAPHCSTCVTWLKSMGAVGISHCLTPSIIIFTWTTLSVKMVLWVWVSGELRTILHSLCLGINDDTRCKSVGKSGSTSGALAKARIIFVSVFSLELHGFSCSELSKILNWNFPGVVSSQRYLFKKKCKQSHSDCWSMKRVKKNHVCFPI